MSNLERYAYWYRVVTHFKISKACVENLVQCSKQHYDGHCKDAAKSGGFIVGWQNTLAAYDIDVAEVHATTCELDTACKILESPLARPEFYSGMRKLLLDAIAESERINATTLTPGPNSDAAVRALDRTT